MLSHTKPIVYKGAKKQWNILCLVPVSHEHVSNLFWSVLQVPHWSSPLPHLIWKPYSGWNGVTPTYFGGPLRTDTLTAILIVRENKQDSLWASESRCAHRGLQDSAGKQASSLALVHLFPPQVFSIVLGETNEVLHMYMFLKSMTS